LIEVAPNKLRLVPGEDDEELARLGRKYSVVRLASRTVFGEEIVRRYRSELEDGRPIRWMVGLNSAVEATVARCPDGGEQAISKKKAVQVRELRRRSRLS
jgi:hypothetical protein